MNTVLRVYSPGSPLVPSDIEASFSDGSGLNAPLPPLPTSDPFSLCYYPRSLKPVLVELERSIVRKTPRDFALFISRLELEPPLPEYPDLISLPAPRSRISRFPWLPGDFFCRLAPEKPCTVSLSGPAALALMTRLDYPDQEDVSLQSYQLHVRIDDDSRAFQFETAREANDLFWVDSQRATLGAERTGYLQVPEGQHRLWLQSTAPLYLRLLRKDAGDYLLTPPPDTEISWLRRPSPRIAGQPADGKRPLGRHVLPRVGRPAFRAG